MLSNREYELKNDLARARQEALIRDVGLSFYSSYVHNFQPGIFDSEDVIFRNRLNFGFDWSILGNGLTANKRRADQLGKEIRINELYEEKSKKEENYIYNYNYIIYLFNKSQKEYLDRRFDALKKYLDLVSKLYLVRTTSWEDVLDIKSKKEQVRSQLSNLNNYNQGFDSAYLALEFNDSISGSSLPLLDLVPEQIFSNVKSDSLNRQILDLEKQRLDLQYAKGKDLGLRSYVRYNIFDSQNTGTRTYGSVGLTFSAPLFGNKQSEEIKIRELGVLVNFLGQQTTSRNNELMNHYYEYQYTLKQFIQFYGNRELSLEKLRKEITRDYLNDAQYTPLRSIMLLDELYTIEFDLLDIKQKLYLKLLKIYTLLNEPDPNAFTIPVDISNYFDRMAGIRSIYIWSDEANSIENGFLTKYAINNDISSLMVSFGKTDKVKLNDLFGQASSENIIVNGLIGENSYAQHGYSEELDNKITEFLQYPFNGLNLDIEPHALDDWESRKEEYLDNLVSALKGIRDRLPKSKKLSISIPVFYPKETLAKLFVIADEVVVMCYEQPVIEKLLNSLEEEVALGKKKMVLAIRADDFSDRLALEDFVKRLISATEIDRIAIHDLGRLIELDQKTILGN